MLSNKFHPGQNIETERFQPILFKLADFTCNGGVHLGTNLSICYSKVGKIKIQAEKRKELVGGRTPGPGQAGPKFQNRSCQKDSF